jgi:ankyrin repeat domain-containing protein 50
LDATYERILQSIDNEDREHAHRALELLAFSKRPLRVEEVAEAIIIVPGCKPFDIDDRFFDPKDVLSICACLVKRVPDSNDLVLAHYSVQEFLLSHRIHQSTAAYFGLDHQMSQTRIAEACLTYLLSFEGMSTLYSGIEDDYPFLEYAAQHWFEHVNPGTTDSSSMLTSLIFNLMRDWELSDGSLDWSQFLDEDIFYDYDLRDTYYQDVGRLRGRGIITLMCSLQRLDVAISLVEAGKPFHSHGYACGTLLQFAIKESNMVILDRIIAAGCSLDAPLPDGGSALCIAAKKGDSTMMTKLIDLGTHAHGLASHRFHDRGLDFKMEFGALLYVAATYRRPDIMKILLEGEAIADANAIAGKHDSLLSAILWETTAPLSRSVQMVELLTEAGADVNAHDKYCGTPMHTFLCRLFPPQAITRDVEQILSNITPVIKILLSAGADPNARGRLYPATVRSIAKRYSGHSLWERSEMLHKAGASLANLEALGPRTGTPLQAVCCLPFESADTVMALLEAGADPNLSETETESPLNMAIKRGYKSIIKTLEAAGAGSSFSRDAEKLEQPTSNTEEFEIDVTKGEGAKSPTLP